MFNNIAPKYDFLNHFLSLGIDIIWRKKLVKLLKNKNVEQILDVAAGTADLSIELSKLKPKKIYGVDISEEMLNIGKQKVQKKNLNNLIKLEIGDSENLQFKDYTFDAVTVSFGVRNFENLEKGISEMYRVLKSGGNLIVLEFSKPENKIFRALYNFYFFKILPFIGRIFSKDNSAYTYLPASVDNFPSRDKFAKMLLNLGFKEIKIKNLTMGIATVYMVEK